MRRNFTTKAKETAAHILRERQAFIAQLATLLHQYLQARPDPAFVAAFTSLVDAMLRFGPFTPYLAEAILHILRDGLELPATLHRPYFELLLKYQAVLWHKGTFPKRQQEHVRLWFRNRYEQQILPGKTLLKLSQDKGVVDFALNQQLVNQFTTHHWPNDPDRYRFFASIVQRFEAHRLQHMVRSLGYLLNCFRDGKEARAALQPLLTGLVAAPAEKRREWLFRLLDNFGYRRQSVRETLQCLPRYLPQILDLAKSCPGNIWTYGYVVPGIVALDRTFEPKQAGQWISWTTSHLATLLGDPKHSPILDTSNLAILIKLSLAVAENDFATYQACLQVACQQHELSDADKVERSLTKLSEFPRLRQALAQLLPQQWQRCLKLIACLGFATRLSPDLLIPLAQLETDLDRGEDSLTIPNLLSVAPEMATLLTSYLKARQLSGATLELPSGLHHALEQPDTLTKELAYLEHKVADLGEQAPAKLLTRIANLRSRLADHERLLAQSRAEALKKLTQANALAQLEAAEKLLAECFRQRLVALAGPQATHIEMNENWLNAVLIVSDIQRNRRLLLHLLRAHLAGEANWREDLPANCRFLQELTGRGANVAHWLSEFPQTYDCADLPTAQVSIYLEGDPLHVLQMGNYFDTCLSFGNCNTFSTVANACELNKRVAYATDAKGRIIARKLLGINEEWQLVGFNVYTVHLDQKAEQAIEGFFRQYGQTFAAHCNLTLSDEGTVPRLLAQHWYDDGVTPWQDLIPIEEETPPAPKLKAPQK